MAVTLDATLLAAQSSQSRHPIISLTAGPKVADIPFDGSFLSTETYEETGPSVIEHSSGAVIVCYRYYASGTNYGIAFKKTATDQTALETTVLIPVNTVGRDISGITIAEITGGNIGILYLEKSSTLWYLKYLIVDTSGVTQASGTIQTWSASLRFSHIWVQAVPTGFVAAYAHDEGITLPTTGGAYTDSADATFTVEVTQSGTETTAFFRWRKSAGAWSGEVQATGSAQALSDGVTVTFAAGSYTIGQTFTFTAYSATYATAAATISSNPADSTPTTCTIGAQTYTFVDELVAGGNPYEVLIDPLGYAITLENLRCAIMDDTFEGTGEGNRYGLGTVANTSATAIRNDYTLSLTAITAGTAGNSITLTTDGVYLTDTNFSGGAEASIGAVAGGDIWGLWKRTSTDFITWSGEASVAISPLLLGSYKTDPSLTLLASGNLVLFFSYADAVDSSGNYLLNIYYITSTDNGSTWDTPTQLTSNTAFSEVAEHPVGVERDNGLLYMLYTKRLSALRMDSSADGWPDGTWSDWAYELSWDATNRKLYVVNQYDYAGAKLVQNIVKVDVDTWSVDQYWDRTSTTPSISDSAGGAYGRYIGEGHLVPVYDYRDVVDLLDGQADSITHYYFHTSVTYGYTQNVTWNEFSPLPSAASIRTAQVSGDRLYVYWFTEYYLAGYIQVGYFDIGGGYVFHDVVTDSDGVTPWFLGDSEMRVYPDIDRIFIAGAYEGLSGQGGQLRIYSISSGALVDYFKFDNDSSFPIWGINNICYSDGYLFGTLKYEADYSQSARRGLVKINLSSRAVSYHRPSWASINDYEVTSIEPGATGKLIVTHFSYGVSVYDINSDTWELFDSDSVTGMIPDSGYSFRCSAYDSTEEMVMSGYHSTTETYSGIVQFSTSGTIVQSNYYTGTFAGSVYEWTDHGALTQNYDEYDAVGAGEMWVFWQSENKSGATYAVKYDKDGSGVDLGQYLITEQGVTVTRTIDETPNQITFTCSHGHLFDRFNELSTLSQTFARGKAVTLQWGDRVGGVDYLTSGGTFYVTAAKVSYERGQYSTVTVTAEDERVLWMDRYIYVSASFDTTPQEILRQIWTTYCGVAEGDIDLPTISSDNLSHQWVDTTVDEIVQQICDRYGYYATISSAGKYTVRPITETNDPEHIYAVTGSCVSFEPDDSYSDFTNRVTVTGQEQTYTEVSFEEEQLGSLTGTVGWWGGTKEYTIYYSDDHETRAYDPRLSVLESVTSIGFALSGGITESITYEDPNHQYVIVTVESPNLTPELIAAFALLVASYFVPDAVILGETIRIGSYLSVFAIYLCMQILGAVGSYSYEIYAYPEGEVTQSVQGSADDTEHQTELGYVIEKTIEDPLCYSTSDCETVAAFELMVCRLQRKRIKITKIAHLQDEDGDTIEIPHPYSGGRMRIFVTNITRTFTTGVNGGFIDEIEGWYLL